MIGKVATEIGNPGPASSTAAPGSAPNRRCSDRFSHCSQVLVRAETSTFVKASSCDFSPRGARLNVPEPLPAGSRVALNVPICEPHQVCPRLLSVQATVMWTRAAEKGAEIGVAFQGGCPADLGRLQAWLHSQLLRRKMA